MAEKKKRLSPPIVFIPSPKSNYPQCLVVPVATGTVSVGNVLSTTVGTWTNSPVTYYYQWQRNNIDIPGAIYPNYTVVNADLTAHIHCLVTAWNNSGVGYAYSNDLAAGGGGGSIGQLFFNLPAQSGLLVLLEDI